MQTVPENLNRAIIGIVMAGLIAGFLHAGNTAAADDNAAVETGERVCRMLQETGLVTLPPGWTTETETGPETQARHTETGSGMAIRIIGRAESFRGLRFAFTARNGDPTVLLTLDGACAITAAQRIEYASSSEASAIVSLEKDGETVAERELLNPPVPQATPPSGPVVALIDTGVNYTLPSLAARVARAGPDTLLGWDFWDDDPFPYDMDPRANPYFPRRHGTTVFSVLAREAPNAAIAVYRFPATNLCAFGDLIADLQSKSIRIASLSMGSDDRAEWTCFAEAAASADILFIVSAGNNGRDIDDAPVYPAALDLENILVATSSSLEGRLGQGSNSGAFSVDFLIPAERVEVIDHRGVRADTGGTSYAAPRLAAMAVRYLGNHPDAGIEEIRQALIARAVPVEPGIVRYGWIPDPTDDYLLD